MSRIQILSLTGSILLLCFIVELVRRRKLKVEYSILWLAAGSIILGLSIERKVLDWFGSVVGVFYAPAALFLVAMIFGILLFIHFSVVISKLTSEHTILAQRIALLESMIEKNKMVGKNQNCNTMNKKDEND